MNRIIKRSLKPERDSDPGAMLICAPAGRRRLDLAATAPVIATQHVTLGRVRWKPVRDDAVGLGARRMPRRKGSIGMRPSVLDLKFARLWDQARSELQIQKGH
jgi:hypothetical protein